MTSSPLGRLRLRDTKPLLFNRKSIIENRPRAKGDKMSELPTSWKLLKLDLFDNATTEQLAQNKQMLKLAISIQKQDSGDWMYYRAKLNSPLRNVRRGVSSQHDTTHYKLLENLYNDTRAELRNDLLRINASKIYRKGYADTKRTIDGFSTVVAKTENNWLCCLLVKHTPYWFSINGANISQRARRTGIIASKTFTAYRGYDMASVDELL